MSMSEPTTGAAAGIAAYKAGLFTKLGVALGAGLLGGAIMAAFDPPKDRKELAKQGAAAGMGGIFFGPIAARVVDYYVPWIDLNTVGQVAYWEFAGPIFFLCGALSWGVFGALAKARQILRDKAAERLAKAAGIEDK
ncbi:hypothetical protein IP84_17090 [beta proteobacterium AAP99]|nr:hypothetical protein IP84_17090 [beta proteobacterium AAP99]